MNTTKTLTLSLGKFVQCWLSNVPFSNSTWGQAFLSTNILTPWLLFLCQRFLESKSVFPHAPPSSTEKPTVLQLRLSSVVKQEDTVVSKNKIKNRAQLQGNKSASFDCYILLYNHFTVVCFCCKMYSKDMDCKS